MIKNILKKCIEQMSLSNESRNGRGFLFFLLTKFGLLMLVKTRQPKKKNRNKQTKNKKP